MLSGHDVYSTAVSHAFFLKQPFYDAEEAGLGPYWHPPAAPEVAVCINSPRPPKLKSVEEHTHCPPLLALHLRT